MPRKGCRCKNGRCWPLQVSEQKKELARVKGKSIQGICACPCELEGGCSENCACWGESKCELKKEFLIEIPSVVWNSKPEDRKEQKNFVDSELYDDSETDSEDLDDEEEFSGISISINSSSNSSSSSSSSSSSIRVR